MIEWRKTDYEGYEVSSCGEVRSIDRTIIRSSNGSVFCKGKLLKCQLNRRGYPTIRIVHNKRKVSVRIHRLVAKSFIPNPDNLPQVNHIDGNKQNNSVGNLEWVDNSKNQLHAIKTGLKTVKFAKESSKFTGSVEVYNKDGALAFVVSGNREMQEHGLDFRMVSACLHGRNHTHRGYTFKKLEKEQNSVI